MKKRVLLTFFIFFIFSNLLILSQEKTEEEVITEEVKKVSRCKFGFTERFRFSGWDNAISLNADDPVNYSFTRLRSNLTVLWDLSDDIDIFLKITNENRIYLSPVKDFNVDEIFFDNLYVKWKNPAKIPVVLTIGRQNIMLGEGFIMMDGHPLDGSRSNYFNAFRLDYDLNEDHKLTGFLTYVAETDNILPVINDRDQSLLEQPEFGMGIYYTGSFNKFNLDVYFVKKNISSTDTIPAESGINTFGTRMSFFMTKNFFLTVEGAYQTGSFVSLTRAAWGGYFHAEYEVHAVSFIDRITIGGIYLGGDNPETEKWEGWDPVFSRWPKWSESFIYTLIKENDNKVAYWSNLYSLYAAIKFAITDNVNFDLTYHFLKANEKNPDSLFTSGPGKTRGGLIIGRLNFRLTKYLSGHFLWENFSPGDYYFEGADSYNWLRFELILKM